MEKIVICNRWMYRVKLKEDRSLDKYKSSLVTKGYDQTKGIDYKGTFSPLLKLNIIKVLTLTLSRNQGVKKLDVNNVFWNGDLEEDVYIFQPEGFIHPKYQYQVFKLNKTLYGLKQVPSYWFLKLNKCL